MPHFVSNAIGDDEKIMTKYRGLVNGDLGHPDGTLIFDESGFTQKGNDSIAWPGKCKLSIGKGT